MFWPGLCKNFEESSEFFEMSLWPRNFFWLLLDHAHKVVFVGNIVMHSGSADPFCSLVILDPCLNMQSNSLVRMHRDGPTFRPTAANFCSPYDFIHEIRHILEVYGMRTKQSPTYPGKLTDSPSVRFKPFLNYDILCVKGSQRSHPLILL